MPPLPTRPGASAAASLTALTNEDPSSSAGALMPAPCPAARPRQDCAAITVRGPRLPWEHRVPWPVELRMASIGPLRVIASPAAMPERESGSTQYGEDER